jgi:hypothetical protein
MMKSKQWDLVLLLGALCFVVDAVVMVFGNLDQPWKFFLNVLGLILIGAGAFGKKRAS